MPDFSFPVFGSGGNKEGELSAPTPDRDESDLTPRTPDRFRPRGQCAATDSEFFHFKDPAKEVAERERRIDQLFEQANPQLHRARQVLSRCEETSREWGAQVRDIRVVVSNKVAAMGSTSPDAPFGTRLEREQDLHVWQAELAEAEQEYAASVEELEAAKARVEALVMVTP
ncbi:MAG TPA: hypothetical protein VNX60_05055 [Candidatus Acidoferrum sp.]|jgi:hypothetical protein|nr:hypothetical protein [Candidatus Acidoferrum sp.]